ncbi:hypothetical protein [Rhodoferax sp.]|uniref:hypothetical protein n=1 Tax=Rhodoferax sp. TaxID=50421 RepID=UPI002769B075|nr:hypothetical protein [Rhodoferax sp.]
MTAAHTHNCAAVGCQKQVPLNLLMCMEHWRMVPAPLAREVNKAWRIRDRGEARTLAYQAAVAAAVKAVEAKQHRKIAERSGGQGDLLAGDDFGI